MGKLTKLTKITKRAVAYLLTFVMVMNVALTAMPAMTAEAAASGKTWIRIAGGSSNSGGHAYGNANTTAPVALMYNTIKAQPGKELSMTLKPSDNWGIFHSYVDDNNWLYVGKDPSSGWYYQYKINGAENYPGIAGLPEVAVGEEMSISISLDRETLSVTVNGTTVRVTNQTLISYADNVFAEGKTARFGVKTNKQTEVSFADVTYGGVSCMDYEGWSFCAERAGQVREKIEEKVVSVSGTVTDSEGAAVEGATVRLGLGTATTDAEGKYTIEGITPGKEYTLAVTKKGYVAYSKTVTVTEAETTFDAVISLKGNLDLSQYNVIESDAMKVYIGKNFPLVAKYEMKATGKTFRGNETALNEVVINGIAITPTVEVVETTATSQTYAMNVAYGVAVTPEDGTAVTPEEGTEAAEECINLDMKVKISVNDNDLTWEVIEVNKKAGCDKIATIDIPELNLVSVDETEEASVFAGANTSTTTTVKADTYITFADGFLPGNTSGYLYAFLSNGNLSAGLTSNSEIEGDKRVERVNGADYMALTSAAWYYECGDANNMATTTLKGYDYPISELPYAKVCIADDMNGDEEIDWNDGAIAFRDIMHRAYGSEVVKDTVNHRIVMNFSSMAPNSFLLTADNIKKVYLATDGLPQAVVLKGYGNEGHDSANSEYADIAEREGGLEDFKKLIQIAHDYNTEVGIHVNAQEAYPEAKSFCDEMLMQPYSNGWGWLDQSHVINKLWDLSSQARYKRFVQLYDRINGTDHLDLDWEEGEYVKNSQGTLSDMAGIQAEAESFENNMDLIYLDVWYQDAWETRQIAREINSLGWRFSTEFSAEGEYDSTWQHWSTDAAYGGATAKGFNSDIIRFIRNDQRDSQVLNYPSYGGTADNPLLGGYRLYGFEGWGGDQNFNNYIYQTFNQNFPTRFLQHYEVIKWVNYEEGESPVGNTEKEITLSNGKDTVVVTRNEAQRNDDEIERKVTLNGKVVLNTDTEGSAYLLPWTNEGEDEKLYHWNLEGGTTTWELGAGWNEYETLTMWELSDQGRINEQTVNVVNGTVTLEAKASTAYVVVTEGGKKLELKNNFGEMDYVVDPGFNGYAEGEVPTMEKGWYINTGMWGEEADSPVYVAKAPTGDQRLVIDNPLKDVSAQIDIRGLEVGKDYVAEVYVDNRSDAKAMLEVFTDNDLVSAYTEESILANYVQCDQEHVSSLYDSKMQRMQVSFKADSEMASLRLSREAGEGVTYFDDIRVVEQTVDNYKYDITYDQWGGIEEKKFVEFVQDFESVVQGLYPFAIGSAQGVTDHRTHLSQLNAPYTQAGWNGRVIDDVITDGTINGEPAGKSEWSLKHHTQCTGIVYQTIPQNFRFEAGKAYTVEFDYQAGAACYAMVVGDGTTYTVPAEYLAATRTTGTQHASIKVVGSTSGQTWIGLFQNASLGASGSMGQGDFTLDNLVIKLDETAVGVTANELYVGETAMLVAGNGVEVTTSADEVVKVDMETKSIAAVGAGTATLTFTKGEEVLGTETVTVLGGDLVQMPAEDVEKLNMTVTSNTEEPTGEGAGNGVDDAAIDGDSSTFWHSQWSGSNFAVSESNPAWIEIDLGEEMDLPGFMFQQRNGANGRIMKYSYEVKDAAGNLVASKEGITLSAQQQASGAIVFTRFAETVKAKKVKVIVLQGSNGNACMAEFAPVTQQAVATNGQVTLEGTKVAVGGRVTLEPVCAENTFVKGLAWTSSDEWVATVDANGVVTGLNVGDAVITAENAAGVKASCTVSVREDGSKLAIALTETEYTYDGTAKKPTVSVQNKWEETVDAANYKVVYENANSVDAGTYKVTITFVGEEYMGEVVKTYTINKLTAEGLVLDLDKTSYEYTGSVQKPAVTVKDAKGNVVDASNYDVVYSDANSKDAGTYTVTVNFKKNYEGKLEANYVINKVVTPDPKPVEPVVQTIADKDVTVAASAYYTGKALTPAVTVKVGTTTLVAGKDYTVTYKNNTNIGTATVVVLGNGTTYKGTVTKTFKIAAKKNTSFTVKGLKYKITSATAVSFTGVTNKNVTKVTVPAKVKIGGVYFKVTAIANKALKGKAKLKTVVIGDNVTSIGTSAFEGCKKLTQVTVGKKVTKIGASAFKSCGKLSKIVIKSTGLKSVGKNALKGIKANAKITVPAKKLASYKNKVLKNKGQGKKVKITK